MEDSNGQYRYTLADMAIRRATRESEIRLAAEERRNLELPPRLRYTSNNSFRNVTDLMRNLMLSGELTYEHLAEALDLANEITLEIKNERHT